jgi:TatD DNase family protein
VAGQIDALARLVAAQPPHALGEIGLDALGDAHKQSLPRQEAAFRTQLALARERDLPLVLHILRAHDRALRILTRDGVPRRGGVVHSYSGARDLVPRYLALGLHLSFAGPVASPAALRVHEAARAVPGERLLCETDAPFQTPLPHRPADNEPAFLPAIASALATIRGEAADDVARYTEENARRLFAP